MYFEVFRLFTLIAYLVVTANCHKQVDTECQALKEEVQMLREEVRYLKREFQKSKTGTKSEATGKRFIADEIDIESTVMRLEKDVKSLVEGSGSNYVRWGRTTCPGNSTIVYKGYMGGNVYTDKGGPANYLCLPDDPSWAKYQDGIQNEGNSIYGTEYEHHGTTFYPFPQNMFNEDVPCVVCNIKKPQNIMVPARTNCHTGWHLEYTGYLMTISSLHPAAGEYICIDSHPEPIPHGSANTNGNVMYLVEAVCGTLPCLPYVNGREFACSVCSK